MATLPSTYTVSIQLQVCLHLSELIFSIETVSTITNAQFNIDTYELRFGHPSKYATKEQQHQFRISELTVHF